MYTFKLRRDLASTWTVDNPVLSDGEPGFEKDTRMLKVGDGRTPWNELDYIYSAVPSGGSTGGGGGVTDEQIINHINSTTPHPVYDSGPSLLLLYQNAKV